MSWPTRKGFVHGVVGTIFPSRCPFCDRFTSKQNEICADCTQSINRIDQVIPKVSLPRIHMDGVTSCFAYEGLVRDLIHSFKFGERLDLIGYLAGELSDMLSSSDEFDAIVPVPMHATKIRARGFNPASMLAKRVARALHIPMRSDLLRRVKQTPAQMELHRRERIGNVRGVFASRCDAGDAKRILLMDDVFTTGATANECARVLKGSGAREIIVATVARTL